MNSAPRLYIRHVRLAALCRKGTQTWFERQGWSWSDFLTDGRPIEDFEDTGCPLAARAVVFARAEAESGNQ